VIPDIPSATVPGDAAGRAAAVRVRAALAAVAASASLPFLLPFAAEPIPSFHAEWWAAALGLGAATLLAIPSPPPGAAIPRAVLLPLGLAVLVALHGIAGHAAHGPLAVLVCCYLLWGAAMMAVGRTLWTLAGPARVAAALAAAVLAAAAVNAVLAGAQAAGVAPHLGPLVLPFEGRASGNTGQPNHLADLLALGVASAAWLAATRRLAVASALALSALLAAALVLAGSRAGWAYLGGLVLLAVLARARFDRGGARRLLVVPVVALTVLAAGHLAAPGGAARSLFAAREGAPPAAVRQLAADERPVIWRAALRMLAAAPLAGAGQGRFAERFFVMAPELDGPRAPVMTHNAHNLPMHVGAVLGLPGLAVLAAGLAAWWSGARRVAREAPRERWLPQALLLVIALHSLVEFPLWHAHFLGLAALAFGALDGARLESAARRVGRIVVPAVVASGWAVILSLAQDYRFLEDFLARRAGAGEADVERLLEIQRRSLLGHYAELGFCRAIPLDVANVDDALALSAAVMRAAPLPDVVYRYAFLLERAGDGAGARLQWSRAVAAYPADAAAALRKARMSGDAVLSAFADELESKGVQR
jgi:O-antigen ligase